MIINRYDDETRLAFHYAREEANSLGQNRVEPEHLLLGIMRSEGGGREVLESLGAKLEELRQRVREASSGSSPTSLNDAPAITPQSRRVMEQAAHEARKLGASVTSSQHLLLALLEVDSPVLQRVLRSVTPDLSLLRERAERVPNTTPEQADDQEAAGRRAQQQAMSDLLGHLERRSSVPAGGQSRAELLGVLLQGAAPALLPRLEEQVDRWLSDASVSATERREIVHVLMSVALNRPRERL